MQNKVNFLKSKVMYVFMTLCVSVLCAVCMGSVAKATGTPSVVKDKAVTFVKHWKSSYDKTQVAKDTAVKFELTLEGANYYLWVQRTDGGLQVAKTEDTTASEAVPPASSWGASVTYGGDDDNPIEVSAKLVNAGLTDGCIEEWNIVATGCAHSLGITGTVSSDFEITDGATMYQNSFREMDIEPKNEAWHVSSGPESGLSAARTYTLKVNYNDGSDKVMDLLKITTNLDASGVKLHPVNSLTVEILASDYLKFKDLNETGAIETKGLSTLVFEYGKNECDFQLDICWNADGDLAYKLKNAPAEILASLSTALDLTLKADGEGKIYFVTRETA